MLFNFPEPTFLNSIHSPHKYSVERVTPEKTQWKKSIIDDLDLPNKQSMRIPPLQRLKLSKLSQKLIPDEASDPFSPLPIPPDADELQSDDTPLDEAFTDNSEDMQDLPDVELEQPDVHPSDERTHLLRKIKVGASFEDSWDAYSRLIDLQKSSQEDGPHIPHHYLHFLASRLAKMDVGGRRHFFRLLSVLTCLRTSGGTIFDWEWNSLIYRSARIYRKTTVEDYRVALGILKDMVNSASISEKELRDSSGLSSNDVLPDELDNTIARPDIVTYTILLGIASRTGNSSAVQHALSMLDASRLPWVPKTHSAMLTYYMHTSQFDAFPRVLAAFLPGDLDIMIITRIMWAYAYKGRIRIAMQVYDFLRGNIPPEDKRHFEETPQGSFGWDSKETFSPDGTVCNPILSIPGFIDHATMTPNGITYTMMIQALCYNGDLIGALTIFRDMLSTIRTSDRPAHIREFYKPRPSIYRSFFLGFARHAGGVRTSLSRSLMVRDYEMDTMPLPEFAARLTATPRDAMTITSPGNFRVDSPWSLENLEIILENLLDLDLETAAAEEEKSAAVRLSDRTIYWIMVSFAKTTNNDWYKLYTVWTRLDKKFDFSQYRLSKRLRDMRDYLIGRFEPADNIDGVERN
ncbi:hypothetical protein Clacol_001773 [Clathrus columnatus]|uniref:Pentatricopeptide repeat-containing protein n=1 Tax=Clathrus columnatus TaxID=1419009 RepID=A0AAV5A6N1_9AGAM|nr:hypothetical protein Clacol_001773 [Clathrus columnatus]